MFFGGTERPLSTFPRCVGTARTTELVEHGYCCYSVFSGAPWRGTEGPLKAHVALPYRGQTSCGTACCVTLLPQAASGVVHVTLLQLLALANLKSSWRVSRMSSGHLSREVRLTPTARG